jgi:tetratricopeptide (TPR) repeat protein
MNYWNGALLLWKQLYKKENASRMHRKIASVLWSIKGDTEKAKEHHDEALRILEKEPESVELASLFEDAARLYCRTEDETKALSWAEKAIELAKKLNDYEVIANSYGTLGVIFAETGDTKKAIECYDKSLRIALDNGYMDSALRAYNNLAAALSMQEDNEKALEFAERGFELAKKVGAIRWISWIGTGLSSTYMDMGNTSKALPLAEESVALDRKAGNLTNLSYSLNNLGDVYHILGELDKSEQCSREALNLSEKAKNVQQNGFSHMLLGWLYADKSEYVKAKEQIKKAFDVYEKAGAKFYQAYASLRLAWVDAELGEIEKAKDSLDETEKFAVEAGDRLLIAAVDAGKGMLFRAQKKWKESIDFFGKSLQECEALNARRWQVYFLSRYVLCEYAQAYLERGQEGDREEADKLLNQALEMFQKMGAKKDIEKVEAKMMCLETSQAVQKPMSMGHVATGYADLDKLLYGGIPATYAVALASPACDERDLLIRNFLEAGAKNGEVTFYVTMNPGTAKALAEEFQSNFHLFICNPQADTIVKSAPNVVKLKGVENLTEISIALTSAIRKLDPSLKGPRRACIGLVSDVLLQHHTVQTRRWLTGLIPELQSEGFTTLAVMDPEIHPTEEVRAISGLFEGEVNLYEKETEKGLERFLKIKKMSNQKYLANEIALTKTSKVS